ncbi:MAG: hypothetical protein EDR02_02760 [Actinobacteria bacterium]|nr:MAG: hypothetical protein EDR02_02760 [Actinomycetota bacterium]RIK07621.1 MAG: hypothetical protein DCC48_03770 [Acidobacteriota bacterium]
MMALVVDADAHVNEDVTAWKTLDELHPGWFSVGESGGRTVASIEDKLYPLQDGPGCGVPVDASTNPACRQGAADVKHRLRDMDSEGIDIQVLYGGLAIGVTSFADVGLAHDFARAYNDWLIDEMCATSPDRLKAVGIVPLQDIDRAVDELQRVAAKGVVGVTIPPLLPDKTLDDPSLTGFFTAAADSNLAVAIHSAPGMNLPLPAAERFSNYAQVHTLSFPVDQMVALTALAMGGVFEWVPHLRVAFLESGVGWVPYLVHRMGEHCEKLPHLLEAVTVEPREYIDRGQCFFSFEAEEPLLDLYVEHLGSDSLVYASDYPHWDCDFPGTVQEVRRRAKGLGDDVTAKILGENARRLYGV